ncbi:hypothetical protein DMN91_012523 [Ooceraea biroi]|uniref:GH18 domain-containing protein n=1 Tax=Ooceraea biroi TaxID=2015173 RepID=A0A3L8D5M0_OOCBI|nr:hypothetical protein DMN91_012523 [Ooceraea biroi]
MSDHGTDVISAGPTTRTEDRIEVSKSLTRSNGASVRSFRYRSPLIGVTQCKIDLIRTRLIGLIMENNTGTLSFQTARMKTLLSAVLVILCIQAALGVDPLEHSKVVCYWNSTAYERQGPAKFQLEDTRPALSLCTHLIYGYAHINSNFEITPGSPSLDTGSGYSYYRLATQLKRSFPDLKIYLSVGGNSDPYDEEHKYLVLTETSEGRTKFINSVNRLLNDYDFDGIDLAWQFPPVKVKKQRSTLGSFWHGLKKRLGYGKFQDDKEQEHRDGFTILVRDLKAQLRPRFKSLTVTVLPHVNASVYYDARLLAPNIEAVHLFAFDQKTPDRNPKEADYPAPIYGSYGRVADDNVNAASR